MSDKATLEINGNTYEFPIKIGTEMKLLLMLKP